MNEAIAQVTDKLSAWWTGFLEMLPNLGVAILVVLGFWGLSRVVKNLMEKVLHRSPVHDTAVPILSRTLSFVVLAVGLVIALGILQLQEAAASLLAGAGIVGLALGLAFQDIAGNYFAGFMLSFRRPIAVGDLVESNGVFGTVDEIELRSTYIRTPQGQRVMIPNSKIFNEVLTNYTAERERRVDVAVGVSYGDDLEKAEKVAIEAVESLSERLESKPVQLFYEGFGGSSIDFQIRFWVDHQKNSDFLAARSNAIKAIKKAFDQNEITIPFPIRTLDFGIEGGATLAEMLPRSSESHGTNGKSAPSTH